MFKHLKKGDHKSKDTRMDHSITHVSGPQDHRNTGSAAATVASKAAKPVLIGHGSYGYIFYPPLVLDDEEPPASVVTEDATEDASGNGTAEDISGQTLPSRRVSKLMTTTDALKEMTRYNIFKVADPHRLFHLGKLTLARPSRDNARILSTLRDGDAILKDLDNYRVITMEYGGDTARDFSFGYRCKIKAGVYNKATKHEVAQFWRETFRLVRGIQNMVHTGIVHHDIKPSNVVYNKETNRINLIDFGLVNTMKTIRTKAITNKYAYTIFYYNMPPELFFFEKKRFQRWLAYTPSEREAHLESLLTSWVDERPPPEKNTPGSDVNTATSRASSEPYEDEYSFMDSVGLIVKELKHLDEFEKYLVKCHALVNELGYAQGPRTTCYDHIKAPPLFIDRAYETFRDFLLNDILLCPDFDTFLQSSMDTLDIYGLGQSLMYFLVNMYHYLPPDFILDMYALILDMVTCNPLQRISIDQLLDKCVSILRRL
jgi:serine/threonine protein kinase